MGLARPLDSDHMAKDWRSSTTQASRRAQGKPSKRGLVFTLLAIMLAALGAIIGLMFFIGTFREPEIVSVPVTEYEPHFPPNAFARQDGEVLRSLFNEGKTKEAFEHQERERLKHLPVNQTDPLVVQISAHALARGQEVFLLPGDAKVDEPDSWLNLKEILRELSDSPSRQKLLILDIMQPIADARLGVLVDDVAARTEELLRSWEKSGASCFVLCPCSGGEVAQVSEELGSSLFDYYLAQGLSGAAERYNPKKASDGRVSVRELADFVRTRVSRWAWENRNASQTPALFGNAADFHLTRVSHRDSSIVSESKLAEAATPAVRSYPEWLRHAWEIHDRTWAMSEYRINPQAFRQFEGILLRSEEAWRGQGEEEKIRSELASAMEQFQRRLARAAKQVERILHPDGDKARNLSMAYAEWKTALEQARPKESAAAKDAPAAPQPPSAAKPEDEVPEKLTRLFARWDQIPTLPAKEQGDAKAAIDKSKTELIDHYRPSPILLAWCTFIFAGNDPDLTQSKLQFAVDLLRPLRSSLPSPSSYPEMEMMIRLANLRPDDSGKWPAEVAIRALKMTRLAEKATLVGPQVFPWVHPLLKQAEATRRRAEQALFQEDSDGSRTLLPILDDAVSHYEEVERAAQTVREAQETLDRAMIRLPAYLTYLNEKDLNLSDSGWTDAVNCVGLLWEIFSRPSRGRMTSLQAIRIPAARLQEVMQRLERRFQPAALAELEEQAKKEEPSTYWEMEYILATPCVAALDRIKLWQTQRGLGSRLNDKTKERDRRDDQALELTPMVKRQIDRPQQASDKIAARRARLILDLLKSAGFSQTAAIEQELVSSASSALNWTRVGEAIQNAYGRLLRAQYDQRISEQKWLEADRLGRIFNPFDFEGVEQDDVARNPNVQQASLDAREYRDWLDEKNK
jgi:hypothetical protein